jgi:hypothetical protein
VGSGGFRPEFLAVVVLTISLYLSITRSSPCLITHLVFVSVNACPNDYDYDYNYDVQWDHRTFPGAVPRSFVPPIILGIASFPASVFMGIVMNTMELTSSAIDVQQIGE